MVGYAHQCEFVKHIFFLTISKEVKIYLQYAQYILYYIIDRNVHLNDNGKIIGLEYLIDE